MPSCVVPDAKNIHYCSAQHQAEHWKQHKNQCAQGEVDDDSKISGLTIYQELLNVRNQFNISVTHAELGSILKENEDDELIKIEI